MAGPETDDDGIDDDVPFTAEARPGVDDGFFITTRTDIEPVVPNTGVINRNNNNNPNNNNNHNNNNGGNGNGFGVTDIGPGLGPGHGITPNNGNIPRHSPISPDFPYSPGFGPGVNLIKIQFLFKQIFNFNFLYLVGYYKR